MPQGSTGRVSAQPDQVGANYTAHLTVGLATVADLKAMQAEPFDEFDVQPVGLAVLLTRQQRHRPHPAQSLATDHLTTPPTPQLPVRDAAPQHPTTETAELNRTVCRACVRVFPANPR